MDAFHLYTLSSLLLKHDFWILCATLPPADSDSTLTWERNPAPYDNLITDIAAEM